MIFRFIVIMLLMMVILGAALKEGGTTQESLDNSTSKLYYDTNVSIEATLRGGISEGDSKALNIMKIAIGKYADVFLYIGIEGMRESINYGYEHPNFNFKALLLIITAYLLLSLTIPIIYLVSFIWFGIYSMKIWFKEFKKKKGGR